ncbi:MAG TPA: LysM domain-containing protein [Nitrospiraceae bacterium]|nr:LysM domain-containing protein [Nitrospiraceae bacterium]
MTDPLQFLMQAAPLNTVLFAPNSRYHAVPTAVHRLPDGTAVPYVKRRFIPPPEKFALLQEHALVEGERLDHLAARYFGDPESFWRICDANGAMRPDELTEEVGRRIRITLPEGITGVTGA